VSLAAGEKLTLQRFVSEQLVVNAAQAFRGLCFDLVVGRFTILRAGAAGGDYKDSDQSGAPHSHGQS
jgi:hypothetical protein